VTFGRRPAIALLVSALSGCAAAVPSNGIARPDQPPPQNFLLPAIEIVAMNAAVNLVGRRTKYAPDLKVSFGSIKRNVTSTWVQDHDPFVINQLLHPFQGAMYHGMARSSGLNYWQAAAYTFAGSALWEIAGERTPPSRNDQIASGIAGSFFGEPLFRAAHRLLKRGGGPPGFWRTLTATVISPPTVVNRKILGDRVDLEPPGTAAAIDVRLELGAMAGPSPRAAAGFLIDQEVSSTTGGRQPRPFDHFRLEGGVSSTGFERLSSRGLIAGRDYRGYDYFAPDVFRLSSTSVSSGTSTAWQWPSMTLRGTVLLGVGYTVIEPVTVAATRYDVAPQALLGLQLTSRHAVLDLTAREYIIGAGAGFGSDRHEAVFRGDAALVLRLPGRHGIALTFARSQRAMSHPGLPSAIYGRSSIGVFYTILSPRPAAAVGTR
jgi:hypothetical protein